MRAFANESVQLKESRRWLHAHESEPEPWTYDLLTLFSADEVDSSDKVIFGHALILLLV